MSFIAEEGRIGEDGDGGDSEVGNEAFDAERIRLIELLTQNLSGIDEKLHILSVNMETLGLDVDAIKGFQSVMEKISQSFENISNHQQQQQSTSITTTTTTTSHASS
eukprot:m.136071 g.136071  ORF g.136071 m.136071 type:complete len:107 (-) comp10405_c0_seq1:1107-1427(-)